MSSERTPMILSLLLLLLAMAAPAIAQEDTHPAIEEFRRYFKKSDPAARCDLVERLLKADDVAVVALLEKSVLTDKDYHVRDAGISVLAELSGEGCGAAVLALLDSSKAPVREAAALAAGRRRWDDEPPVTRIAALAASDKSMDVRIAACDALGRLGSEKATPTLAPLVQDRKDVLAIAAIDALAMIKDPAATPALLPVLEHPSWRLQVAAINALGLIRPKAAVGPIIEYLAGAEGRPREDARRALVRITQRTFGMGADTWRDWWSRTEDGWEVPPEKKVEDDDVPSGNYARKPTRYHRIPTYSHRLLFVIDISGSMKDEIKIKAGRETKKTKVRHRGTRKIDIAREELASTLRGLHPETQFNVLAFETDVREWKKSPVSASPGNVQDAIRWIQKQKPRATGGRSVGAGSSAVGKDGMIMGRTNTYGVLRKVYGYKGRKRGRSGGRTTRTHWSRMPKPKWDTVYFLSDGQPTEGEIIDVNEILDEVRNWNRTIKMKIHTIGMNETNQLGALLNGLSSITGGKTVFLGE